MRTATGGFGTDDLAAQSRTRSRPPGFLSAASTARRRAAMATQAMAMRRRFMANLPERCARLFLTPEAFLPLLWTFATAFPIIYLNDQLSKQTGEVLQR